MIAKPDFSLNLPGEWAERELPDGYEFNETDGIDQAVIQILPSRNRISSDQQRTAIDQLFLALRENILQLSEHTATLLPAGYDRDEHSCTLSFVGTDPANHVVLFGRIVAARTKIVTVTYYRYLEAAESTEFVAWAQPICRSLTVIESD